jgi:tRNA1(Val) A37 N6-methylase TrmN6
MPKINTNNYSLKEIRLESEIGEDSDNFSDEFSNLSKTITNKMKKIDKKKNGIFFTPPKTINYNLDLLKPYINDIKNVLEPSCGSCEYVLKLNKKWNHLKINGIEFNKTIYDSIKHLSCNNIKLYNEDYLEYDTTTKYDLIIGNPPYFVMKKNEVSKDYYDYFNGRPNIFIIFIIKSLNLLNKDGLLSFVLPKNFLNCLYYDKTRKFINKNFKIINIIECDDDYIETKQDTIIVIIQNNNNTIGNKEYVLNINNYTIFGPKLNISALNKLYENSTTLCNMNFNVNVGNVVWNQCKSILTENISKTRLIYSSDILNSNLIIKKYKNKDKKNYIDKKGETDTILVINRGYGVGDYKFIYCLIKGCEYLIENHLVCIRYKDKLPDKDLILLYKKIINSFENEKTKEFIKLYFGNNAINTTEINHILPIYDI